MRLVEGESTERVPEVTTLTPVNVVVLLKVTDRLVTANGISMAWFSEPLLPVTLRV